MITLTIGNSTSNVLGLSIKQFDALRLILSYKEPSQSFGYHRRYLLTKRGDFPTGLLYLVRKHFDVIRCQYKVVDLRIEPKRSLEGLKAHLSFDPYPEQKAASEAARAFKRGIIVASTGLGKSAIIALIIEQLKVNTLIVVPSVELRYQLTESLSKAFGSKLVGKDKPIMVANVDSLDPNKPLPGYDCVILDEFHHGAAATYRKLNQKAWCSIYYRFGLTATPFRSQDHEKLLLEGILSQVIYKISYKTAVSKGYIVPMEAYYIEIPKQKTDAHTYQQVYKELVVENPVRNSALMQLLMSLGDGNKSTLCLVDRIEHGEILKPFPFANGKDGESKELIAAFNRREIDVMIGTTGIVGEGVDTKPCEFVIIAGLGKSRPAFMQKVGRGFRVYPGKESCKIILILDKSHKFTRAHFREQVKTLMEEYGIAPIKIS